ncbi:fimbrial protein [uncultured Parabacteroides sp.]|nr:fimbrial protein [uncultured Parabacteroides sp.]
MKLKNIVGLISAIGLILISCSKESMVDGPDVTGKSDTSFDITLVSEGVETKASAPGYTYATADEIKIQTCAIAVFDTSGKMVGFNYSTFSGVSNDTYESKEAYKITGIETRSGDVKILVVANPVLSEAALKALNTYAAFKAQSIAHNDANATSLTASNLIKFGEVTKTLGTTTKQTIVVPLTQVAARVDVTYNVTIANGWKVKLGDNTIRNINVQSNIFLPEYKINEYTFGAQTLKDKSNVAISDNKISFYTYEKDNPVTILVPVELSYSSRKENKTYQLPLLPTFVAQQCSTNGFVHGHYYEVTGNMSIDLELNCTIKWEVETLEPVTVTIPDFK